ncbi:protein kinase [Streptomyces sp. TG1A-8]|uniref:serine/threonine-protein kinase n=1 Tax=Streptomyces sp. TG1A-8 TaxID=3051385 RepID=UPI00265C760B|nr:serine/threonine-protein kinase [Streptomyces sp. TG1A-8]MDO0928563.1 protein kinase [Streptomyces sp. TG1A-8]
MRLHESALALKSRCTAEILAGRYRLDTLIGSGGAADVHHGFDLRLRRSVAVKVFRSGTDADLEERFQSETVILARLQHPGLVTAFDAGRHNGRAYLVMQLIEGPTLRGRIAQGPLTAEETAALGAALARALAHAHEAGVVHRDVKPSNILLDASGRPHLTDFGISRLLDATTRTATGALIGTAAYLSPEQVLGRPVGLPADVYALGLVLLECLTGRLEYDGGPLEAAIARLHRPPVLPAFLPEEFAALLRDMTALDEEARPPAQECARALTALAGTVRSVPVVPAAPVTSVVPPGTSARDADATHRHPSPAAERTAPRTAPARARALVIGGTAALAAAMSAVLAVSDAPPHHGGDGGTAQAVSRPSQEAGTPRTSPAGTGPVSAAASSSARGVSTAPLHDAAAPHRGRPTAGSASTPARGEPVTGAAGHGTATSPARSGPGATPGDRFTPPAEPEEGTAEPEEGTAEPEGTAGAETQKPENDGAPHGKAGDAGRSSKKPGNGKS